MSTLCAGHTNVRGRLVLTTAVYGSDDTALFVDGCEQTRRTGAIGSAGMGVQVGTRNDELGRFFLGDIGEVIAFPRALNDSERGAVEAYLSAQWPALVHRASCRAPPGPAFQLSQHYAITRYVQAIQSRGTIWPIKFNGMAFVAAM